MLHCHTEEMVILYISVDISQIHLRMSLFDKGTFFIFFSASVPSIVCTIALQAGRIAFSASMWDFEFLALISASR